jgi:hypothetical protein
MNGAYMNSSDNKTAKELPEIILLITAGRTDIDFVVKEDDGTFARAEIPRKEIRAIHEFLIKNPQSVDWWKDKKEPEKRNNSKDISLDSIKNIENQRFRWNSNKNKLTLYPAKLIKIVNHLKSRFSMKCAIVLNTCKNDDPEEPIGVGPLLAQWLESELSLPYKKEIENEIIQDELLTIENGSYFFNYLDGDMLAMDSGDNFPVNRKAMDRIDNLIRRLKYSGEYKNVQLHYINAGGIPGYKEQIKACCDYRFPNNKVYHLPEERFEKRSLKRDPENREFHLIASKRISPAEIFHLRKIAEDLVLRGEYVAAYGIISEPELSGYSWVRPIKAWCEVLCGKAKWESIETAIGTKPPKFIRALFTGLRLEADLIAKKYSDAIIKISTFLDAALLDHFMNHIHPLDPNKNKIVTNEKIPEKYIISNIRDRQNNKEHENAFLICCNNIDNVIEYKFDPQSGGRKGVFMMWPFHYLKNAYDKYYEKNSNENSKNEDRISEIRE